MQDTRRRHGVNGGAHRIAAPYRDAMITPSTQDRPEGQRGTRHWTKFWLLLGISIVVVMALTAVIETYPIVMLAVRDVAAVARDGLPLPFFTGWLSNVGIVGWFVSAAVLLVGAQVSHRRGQRRVAAFAGGAGAISLLLGTDDLFMLHDGAIASGEEALLLLWLTLALTWAVSFRRELAKDANLPLLVLTAVFFGHSVVTDLLTNSVLVVHEDASKLAGILLWAAWAWSTAERAIDVSGTPSADAAGTTPSDGLTADRRHSGSTAVLGS